VPGLPSHLLTPYKDVLYVVFAYEKPAGWWRRVNDYRDVESAQKIADAYNDAGAAVMVCRQNVLYGAMDPITGASGA